MKYYVSAVFSFVLWGTFALVMKPLSAYASLDILIHRVIFASFFILIATLLFRRKQAIESFQYLKSITKKQRIAIGFTLFISSIMLGLNWFSYIFVLNNVSVKATALAYLICPILTTVLASLFLKEKLSKSQWFAVSLSVISCLIMAKGHFMDLFYSVFIALTYAIYLVIQKKAIHIDKFINLTFHICLGAIMLLPILGSQKIETAREDIFYILISVISLFYTIIPLFLNNYALKGLDSSMVGTLLYLNPIISFLLAIFYFKETVNYLQILAFTFIGVSIVIFNIAYFKNKNTSNSYSTNLPFKLDKYFRRSI